MDSWGLFGSAPVPKDLFGRPVRGGNLPAGMVPSGEMTARNPSMRESMTDWLRRKLFTDDRAGQDKAEYLNRVAETMIPPYGVSAMANDATNDVAQGNYAGAALNMAVIPFAVAAKTPVNRAAMEQNDILMRAIANTKGARMTPEGVAVSVTRNQRPEQEMMDSVRGGVFYLPEGSKDQKFYSGTDFNANYGGSQKIAGETLFKNPLVAKGATGGKAPEAAFDMLNGKGAYQKMRSEALQSIPPYYIKDRQLRYESIRKFLDKYAPELADNTEYIIENSSKGNQLAYALQEAAVASAARRAGHDGVIGYSVGRKVKEPFMSEVFDVRENAYPSPDGEYSMWPEFFPKKY